jgi:hypothetical protein
VKVNASSDSTALTPPFVPHTLTPETASWHYPVSSARAPSNAAPVAQPSRASVPYPNASSKTSTSTSSLQCSSRACVCWAEAEASSRRQVLAATAATLATVGALSRPAMVLAGGGVPAGFTGVQDAQDNYAFLYPFGWQEVRVDASCTCIVHNVEMRQAACSACIMVMQRAVS